MIIQNDVGNQYAATMIIAAITTTLKTYLVIVLLKRHEGGLNALATAPAASALAAKRFRTTARPSEVTEAWAGS